MLSASDILALVDATRCADRDEAFGKRVFVASMWRTHAFLAQANGGEAMTLEAFKAALLAAWKLGAIKMTRCEMPGAFAEGLAAESAIHHQGAEFSFVWAP